MSRVLSVSVYHNKQNDTKDGHSHSHALKLRGSECSEAARAEPSGVCIQKFTVTVLNLVWMT